MGEEQQVSVETGLATFQDEEEQIISYPLDNVPGPKVENPFPDQTPKRLLERWYQIGNTTYTTATSSGYYVEKLSTLMEVANVRMALSTFYYLKFRAVEFRVQYSTVPMVYGWLGNVMFARLFACEPASVFVSY
jgi:hypothetical protein